MTFKFSSFIILISAIDLQPVSGKYVGCYKEDISSRHFHESPGIYDPPLNSYEPCAAACGDLWYKYAALTGNTACFCGNELPPDDWEDESACTNQCANKSSEMCGENTHVSVHVSRQPATGLRLSVAGKDVVPVFDPVTFTTDVTTGSELSYQFDYGDGAGRTGQNSSGIFQKHFSLPGQYQITVFSFYTETLTEEESTITWVQVYVPVSDVTLDCPMYGGRLAEVSCTVEVMGSSLILVVNYGNESSENFSVPDSDQQTLGPAIPGHSSPEIYSDLSEKGVFLMPASRISKKGYLSVIEMYAIKVGKIQFLVLTPACASYCYSNNSCSVCPDEDIFPCDSNRVFCPSSLMCTAKSLAENCSETKDNTISLNFEIKAVIPYEIQTTGYLYHTVNKTEVSPGDILGFATSSNGANIATTSMLMEGNYYHNSLMTSPIKGNFIKLAKFTLVEGRYHLLQAIVVKPVKVSLFHVFKVNGLAHITVQVGNIGRNTYQMANDSIIVGEQIDLVIIQNSVFGEVGKEINFTILSHAGNNVTYRWDFGDGKMVSTTERTIGHLYTNPYVYNISVEAANLINKLSNTTQISIQILVSGLTLTPETLTPTGNSSKLTLSMKSGSHWTCDWSMKDGTSYQTSVADASGLEITHYYANEGNYSVSVRCHNNISEEKVTALQVVLDPIIGLKLMRRGSSPWMPFRVNWTISMGTNVEFSLKFDGKSLKTFYDHSKKQGHTETLQGKPPGISIVVISGWNSVSSITVSDSFYFDKEIKNPTSVLSRSFIAIGDSVTFTVGASEGSSVNIIWDYKDGFVDNYSIPLFSKWPPGKQEVRIHRFYRMGNYSVQVSIFNGPSMYKFTHTVLVDYPVANFIIYAPTPIRFTTYGATSFYFNKTAENVANFATMRINYGDKTTEELPFKVSKVFQHNYTRVGNYNVLVDIFSPLGSLELSTRAIIVEPIENVTIITEPAAAAMGKLVKVKVRMLRGGTDDVFLEWSFGDGNMISVSQRKGVSPYGIDMQTHSYETDGVYNITVTASNLLGKHTALYTFYNMYSVTRNASIKTNSPVLFPPGRVTFSMSYDGSPWPTKAKMYWEFGDKFSSTVSDLQFSNDVTHGYSKGRKYIAKLVIFNAASRVEYQINVGVYEMISGVSVKTGYKRFIPISSPYQTGHGQEQNLFPSILPVRFSVSLGKGNAASYTMHVSSKNFQDTKYFTNAVFNYKFETTGEYNINISAVNPFSSDFVEKVIQIGGSNQNLSLTSSGMATEAGMPKELFVRFGIVEDKSCMVVFYGDKTKELYGNQYECNLYAEHINENRLQRRSVIIPLSTSMKLTHVYKTYGTYTVRIIVYNYFFNSTASLTFPISSASCRKPQIGIENSFPHFWMPMEIQYSEFFSLRGLTDLTCNTTWVNEKKWLAAAIDPETGAEIKRFLLSSIPSSHFAELAVPSRFFPVGLYKVTYYVEMQRSKFKNSEIFSQFTITHVKIVPSALIAIMAEGGVSEVVYSPKETLTLSPEKYSYDPDVDKNEPQTFDSFTWFCRDLLDEFPKDAHGNLSLENATLPYTLEELENVKTNDGGCFRQGSGRIDFKSGEISFNTANMVQKHIYELLVIIKKGNKTATAFIHVKISDTAFMRASIRCISTQLCKPLPHGHLISNSFDLLLFGRCAGRCKPLEISYQWMAYIEDKDFTWVLIPQLDEYTQSTSLAEISIKPSLFRHYSKTSLFRFKLLMTTSDGITGEASSNFYINQSPKDGNCSITPKIAQVMSKPWKIACFGWHDTEKIVKYLYYAKFLKDDISKKIYFGLNNVVDVFLPMGPDYNDYRMEIHAIIYDGAGSSTNQFISEVQVLPMKRFKLEEIIHKLFSDKTNYISNIMSKGDLQSSNFLSTQLLSLLNDLAKKSTSEFYAVQPSSVRTPTGYTPDFTFSNNKTLSKIMSDQWKWKYSREREERALVREKIIDSLQNITVASVSAVQLTASTMSLICKYSEECGRNVQKSVSSNLIQMACDILKNQAKESSREELQTAASSISAAAGQIAEAANYHIGDPLQRDLLDASKYMNYDVDIESKQDYIHSNNEIKGKEELMRMSNAAIQTNLAENIIADLTTVQQCLTRIMMENFILQDRPYNVTTDKMTIFLWKTQVRYITDTTFHQGRNVITFPNWCSIVQTKNCSDRQVVYLEIITTAGVNYNYTRNSLNIPGQSSMVTVNFINEDRVPINIMRDMAKPLKLIFPHEKKSAIPLPTEVYPDINAKHWELYFHSFTINNTNVSLHIEVTPKNPKAQFLILGRFFAFPNLTALLWDFWQMVPTHTKYGGLRGNRTFADPYTVFLSNKEVNGRTGKVYIKVMQLQQNQHNHFGHMNKKLPLWQERKGKHFSTNYTLRIYTSNCYYYDEVRNDWFSDKCKVDILSSPEEIHCTCTKMKTYTSSWMVVPNQIDWNFVFSNMEFHKNVTLYVTEIVIVFIFIIVAILARKQDKVDVTKIGLTPLSDNKPEDRYYYEVIVATGLRKNAGTDSKVYFSLDGENTATNTHLLEDKKRSILKRGSVDGFLLATKSCLGTLTYARIWHDNSGLGKAASWYLKYLLLRDLQTGDRFCFLVNRWFAVEKEDGEVHRIIPVAGKEQVMNFGHRLSKRTKRNFEDGHMWISVVTKPLTSRFTRLQRVSCCLGLLFSNMLANAMFYGTSSPNNNVNSLVIGPFTLTGEQIYVGFITNLIAFPINFLIVTLFRKSRSRNSKFQQVEKTRNDESHHSNVASVDDISPIIKNLENNKEEKRIRTSYPSAFKSGKKKKKFLLPWWFRIIAWLILLAEIVTSIFFVTMYGISFEEEKCKRWITSMMISFFSSVFLTQPFKVFLTALILSWIIKRPGDEDYEDDEEKTMVYLQEDEEYLHPVTGKPTAKANTLKKVIIPKPPNVKELKQARKKCIKEIKMWQLLRATCGYSIFVGLLMIICYRNRHAGSFLYKKSLSRIFIDDKTSKQTFRDISNTYEFWMWMKQLLIPGLRADSYYNNAPPLFLRGFIKDKVSRIIGYATLRQLRVRPDQCSVEDSFGNLIKECNNDYSFHGEEKATFGVGWQPLNSSVQTVASNYIHRSASELDGYPYWGKHNLYAGGGYVTELRGSTSQLRYILETLEEEMWIDKYTRAVFVEFALYNSQVNLFSVNTILVEWLPNGGTLSSYRFEPIMLLPYLSSMLIFQAICEVLYLIFFLYFFIKEIGVMIQKKKEYFKEFWNLLEIAILIMSIFSFVVYFYRHFITEQLTSTFKKTYGKKYIKFQYVSYWNELLSCTLAWLLFFSFLKFLKLLRFNKRMSMLAATLKNSAHYLIQFSIMFWIVFLAFIQLFYLVYLRSIPIFSNFLSAAESGFLMMMGKFELDDPWMSQPLLTPLLFFLFVFLITFILINMFVSILNESFTIVRKNLSKQSNDHEIMMFLCQRVTFWLGINKKDLKKPKYGRKQQLIVPGNRAQMRDEHKEIINKPHFLPRTHSLHQKLARSRQATSVGLEDTDYKQKPSPTIAKVQIN